MKPIIKIENVSKQYRLGLTGTGTFSHDVNRWWHSVRGKEDPYLKIGEANDRSTKGESDYVWALRDINFEVMPGEVLGIIGKNGAGKSTLLKLLSRVTAPTTGSIKARGRIASLLEVGTGFHPELTGRENVFLNGAIMGMTKPEIRAKFDEIVDFAGCERYMDTPVKRYSSGMYVRLAFAVAAHLEPDILVVDEVLAVGDAEFQKKAIGKMKDVSTQGGRTVLFVSHNMASVKRLCNKAMVISNGSTIYQGVVDEGIQFYLSQNSKNSNVSLDERKDRTNGQIFRFTDVMIKNGMRQNSTEFFSGENIEIELSYILKYDIKIKAVRVLIIDSNGVTRILMNNNLINKFPGSFKKQGLIKCLVPKLPLPKGQYSLQVSVFSKKGIEDDIENAILFSVAGGDFYNTGKEAYLTEGVLVDYDFNFND